MLDPRLTTQDGTRRAGPVRRVRAAISVDRATSGLVVGHLCVAKEHVVFVKGIVEASEGLACLFAERGGDLTIASPLGRGAELRELLLDLATDLGGTFDLVASPADAEAPPPEGAPLDARIAR